MTLDFTNREAMHRWALAVRVSLDDEDTVVKDMFKRPRKRELGPVTHKDNYRAAHKALVDAMNALLKATTAPEESGGPNGGSAP